VRLTASATLDEAMGPVLPTMSNKKIKLEEKLQRPRKIVHFMQRQPMSTLCLDFESCAF
jgi:aminopeptidase N